MGQLPGEALRTLESLAKKGVKTIALEQLPEPQFYANLVIARLHEQQGDLTNALSAVRRRLYHSGSVWYLSTFLRDEARLARLTGDRHGAIRAYQHYIALRSDPEPILEADVSAARVELAKLLAERGS